MSRSPRAGESGFALVTAVIATLVMLMVGLALLSIVDTQAGESEKERVRDQSFNLAESVLTSEAFVLGRSWPAVAPTGDPACSASTATFGDTLGSTSSASGPVARLRPNLNASYTDTAYAGATWQVAICDDVPGENVWSTNVTTRKGWDANGNNRVWVRAQATVRGKTRTVAGIVQVRRTKVLNSRYGAVAGGMADDLGATVNGITSEGVLGAVLRSLFTVAPTVAPDPSPTVPTPNGVTGVRCGVLNTATVGPTCLAGTLGALGALPAVKTLITDGRIENVPGVTSASPEAISQLRQQAQAANTYVALSPGSAPAAPAVGLNSTDTAPPSVQPCDIPASAGRGSVVFIEKVGRGDDYCAVSVGIARQYKGLVIGSGRVVIRGNDSVTPSSTLTANTFEGVVYALNLQTIGTADGGLGLSDDASAGREILRIDRGAHVRGAVHADGRSGRIGVYPPPLSLDASALVDTVIGCNIATAALCLTLKALSGVGNLVTGLLANVGLGGVNSVSAALTTQLGAQRAAYGSAVTANVAAIDALTMYGPSGLMPGTFRDLSSRS